MIRDGRVTLNGARAALGDQVEPGDDVRVDGSPVQPERTLVVLFHKPAGLITTASDPQGRPTVVDAVQSDVPGCCRSAGWTPPPRVRCF